MAASIPSISRAVEKGLSFDICFNSEGKKQVKILTVKERLLHLGDRTFEKERIDRTVAVLTKALNAMPKLPIPDAMAHPTVNTARKYLRTLKPGQFRNPRVRECCRTLLATKLGINRKVFEKNPGFEDFAFKSHLDRYLLHYGHSLKVQPETDELSVLCEGAYQPWASVREKYLKYPLPEMNFPGNPRLLWSYGQEGIQKQDMYAWKELKPYKIEKNPDWGNRYIFEFCACCSHSVRMNGDHSWLRLKTPKGEIYCVGLYRPGKNSPLDNFHFPMRVQKGYLMSPDVSEFWPTSIYRIHVEISKEHFDLIKKEIEEDKKHEDKIAFQLFNGNCTEYVNSKAALAGIRLPTSMHYLRNIAPSSLRNRYQKFKRHLPPIITRIGNCFMTFLSNIILLSLGASITDRKIKKTAFKPHLSKFSDLFNAEKLKFHPPRNLALDIRKEVDQWRWDKLHQLYTSPESNLKLHLKKIDSIAYSLPEKFYC